MFSTIELNGMRETQEAHMMDECIIYHVVSKSKDSRGQYVNTFDKGMTTICGVQLDPLPYEYSGSFVEGDMDAIMRLPLGTVIEPDDEVEITKRFGAEVPVKRYQVVRYTNDGVSGCRAYLKARNVI